ncbi:MAG: ParB/RepB/Spo0J family partition protein [Proteobacteria bacterium]|nr:ParB/RepB/Spo0J family partition protein [Pseudomonadota bacterium]
MPSKFGLGKGLADLKNEMGNSPEISVLAGGERVVVRNIPIAQIAPNPDQPRKTFADSELADLAASIREKGVLQPILVRLGGAQQYEIIAGERRWRASRLAGLPEIPALVKNVATENAMEIALIENVQRENLNPLEEGAAYKNLMEKCGYAHKDISRLIGKSESYIRNIMRLETLPESVKKMVVSGEISASHARAIAVAENPDELARQIVGRGLSVADTESLVKSVPRSSKSRFFQANSLPPETVAKYAKKLKSAVGANVKIRERKGGAGDITIHFESRKHLEEIAEVICRGK